MSSTNKRRFSGFDPDEAPVSSNRESRPRPEELVEMLQMPKGAAGKNGMDAYKRFRPVGNVFVTGQHWVTTKKRDGSAGSFPAPCLNFNPETGKRELDNRCAWCRAEEVLPKRKNKDGKEQALVRFSTDYYIQGIDRAEQENAPQRLPKMTAEERKTGFKDLNSDSWTPYRVQRLSGQDLKKFRNLKDLNVVKIKGERVAKSVFDEQYGCDVLMKYDKTEKVPGNRWTFSKDERTPLTEEEQAYLKWDLSLLIPDDLDSDSIAKEVESWATRMGVAKYLKEGAEDDEDDDDDDVEEDAPKKRRTKAEVTKDLKKKVHAALDDDDDEDEDEDDDLPPSGKKSPAKGKKPIIDDDDEDDDDDDEEDDDPPRKSKNTGKKKLVIKDEDEDEDEEDEDDDPPRGKKAPAKSKKPVIDDDDDEDDEDEDDDPPPRGKKAPAKKTKIVEDDDEDDEDEDDDLPPRGKKSASAKSKKSVVDDDDEDDEDENEDDPPRGKKAPAKSKKPVIDDDDEDEDEDDDEDDPPRGKKGKRQPPPPPKGKKKKVVDDDDDDDDIPF